MLGFRKESYTYFTVTFRSVSELLVIFIPVEIILKCIFSIAALSSAHTMIFGLEARTPFLDLEVYNVARSLPSYAKIQKGVTKPALREAAKEVIPTEAYKKKKLGFPVPLREWIKDDDIYNMIKVKFESDSAKELFNQKKILKLLENRNSKRKDTYKKIWTVYTFLVWYDIYFAS